MDIISIAKKIEKKGGRLYLVGGAIRDEIIGRKIYDKDYCVTGISENEFKEMFPEAKIQGKHFPIFCIDSVEFALARKEIKTGLGHKEFRIETNKNITIQEDLLRRDITINSIAKDVLTNEIIDPFNGIQDIKNKIIRKTSIAFKEDPLRVYRVARILASTKFSIEKETLELMHILKEELKTLSKERVFCELEKALQTEEPSLFFNALRKADVLDVHFKEINNLIGVEQAKEYHPEGDAYNHTMKVLDKSTELTNDLAVRFACLVHDLGKGLTPKSMYPHHYGHDEKGVELVGQLGNRIGVPKKWIAYGKVSAKEHMKGGIFFNMTNAKKVQFIERISKTKLGLEGLQVVVIADKCSTRNTKLEDIEFENIGKNCISTINGKYIKQKYNIDEGENFARKLHQERVKWMSNFFNNNSRKNCNNYLNKI